MSVREQHAAFGESINMRRLCVRMAPEAANPVVHVVDGDQQHVRCGYRRLHKNNDGESYKETKTTYSSAERVRIG